MDSTKVKIPRARFSYAHVFEPHAVEEGQTPKYSVSLIISKDDKQTLDEIRKAIALAAENGKSVFKGAKVPSNYKQPLRDGDIDRPDDEAYENSFFINASSSRAPGVVKRGEMGIEKIEDHDEFYSGCYGSVTVNFYAFKPQGGGVAAGLQNILKTEEGERLSGGASAAEDFGDDDDLS